MGLVAFHPDQRTDKSIFFTTTFPGKKIPSPKKPSRDRAGVPNGFSLRIGEAAGAVRHHALAWDTTDGCGEVGSFQEGGKKVETGDFHHGLKSPLEV